MNYSYNNTIQEYSIQNNYSNNVVELIINSINTGYVIDEHRLSPILFTDLFEFFEMKNEIKSEIIKHFPNNKLVELPRTELARFPNINNVRGPAAYFMYDSKKIIGITSGSPYIKIHDVNV